MEVGRGNVIEPCDEQDVNVIQAAAAQLGAGQYGIDGFVVIWIIGVVAGIGIKLGNRSDQRAENRVAGIIFASAHDGCSLQIGRILFLIIHISLDNQSFGRGDPEGIADLFVSIALRGATAGAVHDSQPVMNKAVEVAFKARPMSAEELILFESMIVFSTERYPPPQYFQNF